MSIVECRVQGLECREGRWTIVCRVPRWFLVVPEVGMAVLGVLVSVLAMETFAHLLEAAVPKVSVCGFISYYFSVRDITWVSCLWAPSRYVRDTDSGLDRIMIHTVELVFVVSFQRSWISSRSSSADQAWDDAAHVLSPQRIS